MPSWVIDWTDGDPQGLYGKTFLRLTDVEEFDASLTKRYTKHFSITNSTLQLHAILLDEIAAVGSTICKTLLNTRNTIPPDSCAQYTHFLTTLNTTFSIYTDWRAIARPSWHSEYPATGEPKREAFARTVLLNQLPLTTNLTTLRRVAGRTRILNVLISIAVFVNRIPQPRFVRRAPNCAQIHSGPGERFVGSLDRGGTGPGHV